MGSGGGQVRNGDVINLGGLVLRFHDITAAARQNNEAVRTSAGSRVSPTVTLLELTGFQLMLMFQHSLSAGEDCQRAILLAFVALIALQWPWGSRQ